MAVSESVLGLYDIVLCYDLTNLEIRHIFWQRGRDQWLSLCWAKWKRTKEDWSLYVERMEHFFLANGITETDKKRAVFLSVVGLSAYRIIRNLVAPKKPGEKSYVELIAALSAHFKPTPSEIVERCRFHSRSRKPGESVATFVAELRSLSEFCNFGDMLNSMIRDRLVCSINDNAIERSQSSWL